LLPSPFSPKFRNFWVPVYFCSRPHGELTPPSSFFSFSSNLSFSTFHLFPPPQANFISHQLSLFLLESADARFMDGREFIRIFSFFPSNSCRFLHSFLFQGVPPHFLKILFFFRFFQPFPQFFLLLRLATLSTLPVSSFRVTTLHITSTPISPSPFPCVADTEFLQ